MGMRDRDKFRGCLIGGAAGDALGYAVEFMREKQIFNRYGEGGIREYELKTQVTAKTVAIYKKSGDFAEAGEKLLELDSRDQQEEIRALENQIKEL